MQPDDPLRWLLRLTHPECGVRTWPELRTGDNLTYTSLVLARMLSACLSVGSPCDRGDTSNSAVVLDWQVPDECPCASDVQREISELASSPPLDAQVRVSTQVVRDTNTWIADIVVTTPDGSHERHRASSPNCDDLADATALIVVLALDSLRSAVPNDDTTMSPAAADAESRIDHVTDAEPNQPAPVDIIPPVSESTLEPVDTTRLRDDGAVSLRPSPTAQASVTAKPHETPRHWSSEVGAFVSGGFGVATSYDTRVGATAGFDVAAVRFQLSAARRLAQHVASSTVSGAGVRVEGWELGLHACGSTRRSALTWAWCGAGRAAQLLGQGYGVSQPRTVRAPWTAVGAGSQLRWSVSRHLVLSVVVDVLATLTYPRFSLANDPLVYTPRALVFDVAIGAAVPWTID